MELMVIGMVFFAVAAIVAGASAVRIVQARRETRRERARRITRSCRKAESSWIGSASNHLHQHPLDRHHLN